MYQAYGATESGNYLIDPDGVGNNKPFKAYCDFDNGKSSYLSFFVKIDMLKRFSP